ncbi:hypothetical protein [Ancylobacter mangrovi]|uniref:hypothetical protein n=1 Tax=Ancylobacter mangrovi TaxID=2972472 RepID=UPI0021630E2C|nr:hypothetical protein [Ancylobacter mangrovi]
MAIVIGLAFATGGTLAEGRVEVVKFAAGTTSTSIKGSIRGDDMVSYSIGTGAGQVMQLLFVPSNRSCYVNVYAPENAQTAVHVGSLSGNEFGINPTAPGSYTARVYLMRNAARRNETCRFTLSIEITGKPGGISAGGSDQLMIDICKGSAAGMYGVQPRDVAIARGVVAASGGGFTLDGTVDKGAEGLKKLRCIFGPDRRFSHVQAMTSDGE